MPGVALTLLLLSLALAADAFAAAVCEGAVAQPRPGVGGALRIGAAFGTAQAIMPLIGWLIGAAAISFVRQVDHWIAFALLFALGAKMLKDASEARGCGPPAPLMTGWALGAAAIATSIDAAAAGVTLPMLGLPVIVSALVIGGVTLTLSAAGVAIGAAAGARIGRSATAVGGVLLILLGVKILAEHLLGAA